MSMKCVACDRPKEWSVTPERPDGVLDIVRLPTEAHLSREVEQFVDLVNSSASNYTEEKSDIAFSLEQHVLSVSLTEMNHYLSEKIYTILASMNMNNEEIFIKLIPAHEYNAFAIYNPSNGGLILGLNSSILDSYSLDDIGFIIGHELGHHHLFHTRKQYKTGLQSVPPEHPLSRKALALSRREEISADRFGLLCCGGDLETALVTIRKTILQAVGKNLESNPKEQALYKFYDTELDGYMPWDCSHPHMSIRSKALIAWTPIAKSILGKKPLCQKALREINDYCEDLLTGMDHDDYKKKDLRDRFDHAVNVLDRTLLGQTQTEIVTKAHTNMVSQGGASNYADAVTYLKEVASPGKRIRILDWLTSCVFLMSSPLEIRNTLLVLAEEFGILSTYKKRVTKMIARHDFITNQLN